MADVGRPTKYNPEYHPQKVVGYCLVGMTDEQIAAAFDIVPSTLYDWKNVHPEFSEAIKKGKEDADIKVAASLYKRATGYKEKRNFTFKLKVYDESADKMVDKLETVEIEESIPPETTAQIFWLKNRQPQAWRERKELEVSTGEVKGVVLVDDDE